MSPPLLLVVLGALLLYQLFVSARVMLSQGYSRSQKIMQLLLIWLVPLLGAAMCQVVLSADRKPSVPRDPAFTPDGGGNPAGAGQDGIHH